MGDTFTYYGDFQVHADPVIINMLVSIRVLNRTTFFVV